MNPEQTAHIGAVSSESTLLVGKASKIFFSRRQKQLNFVVIGALMVKSCKTTEPQTTKATSFIRLVCPVNVRRKKKKP